MSQRLLTAWITRSSICADTVLHMRLAPIIDPSVRKPAPKPVRVDLRKVFGIGTSLWAVALVVALVLMMLGLHALPLAFMCIAGIAIGILMLIWEYFDRWDYRRLGQ